jgi:hypothetical protein
MPQLRSKEGNVFQGPQIVNFGFLEHWEDNNSTFVQGDRVLGKCAPVSAALLRITVFLHFSTLSMLIIKP